MTRMRVLHCVPSLNAVDGGPARSVPALAAAEAYNGADVVVWSRQAPTIDLAEYQNTRFVSGAIGNVTGDGWVPDVIHDHGLWLSSNHAAARFGRHKRIPRVVSPRGMLEPWCLKHRRLRKEVAWQLYQHRDLLSSACLHATSVSESRQFRNIGFEQPIICLPNGVRLPSVDQTPRMQIRDRKEMLFLGRIHPVKGLKNLLDAWQRVNTRGWRLRIVGSDEDGHRSALEQKRNALGLTDSVEFHEGVHSAEKWDLLRRADVLVLPSFSENFGIVAAEALGVGTPVLTTTGTPWSELEERRCGWYVAPTVDGIMTGLTNAIATPLPELGDMGSRGQAWVTEAFSWDDIGRRMLDSYEWLLGTHTASQNPAQIQTVRRAA